MTYEGVLSVGDGFVFVVWAVLFCGALFVVVVAVGDAVVALVVAASFAIVAAVAAVVSAAAVAAVVCVVVAVAGAISVANSSCSFANTSFSRAFICSICCIVSWSYPTR